MTDDPQADRPAAALRDRIADALATRFTPNGDPAQGMRVITDDDDLPAARRVRPLEAADAVLAVLPAPADRAAVLREAADALDVLREKTDVNVAEYARYDFRQRVALSDGVSLLRRMANQAPTPDRMAADRAALIAEILPAWEAVYEPGNVSDYLIGYANSEAAAKGAAEAWMRSQAEVTGRLEWVPDEQLATGRYDRWFELIERHDDGTDTGPGLIVRRRMADEAPQSDPCSGCRYVPCGNCLIAAVSQPVREA